MGSDANINGLTVGRGNSNLDSNTVLGNDSFGININGIDNTAIGRSSLLSNTSGSLNTALGRSSLLSNTSGSLNTALGMNSMFLSSIGVSNTAVGAYSLQTLTTGQTNTGIGAFSLSGLTTGTSNTSIGYGGQNVTTGSNNTFLGVNADFSGNIQYINSTALGYNSKITRSNQIVMGTAAENVFVPGKVGVGTDAPTVQLDVSGGLNVNTVITINNGVGILRTTTAFGNNFIQSGITNTTGSAAPLIFGTINAANEWMRISTNGNVGIGTNNPIGNLHVLGKTYFGAVPSIIGYSGSGQVHITENNGTGPYLRPLVTGGIPSVNSITSGTLCLNHNDLSGVSSILFSHTSNYNSDFGCIQYFDNLPYPNNPSNECSALLIGVENDAAVSAAGADRIVLSACNGTGYIGINTFYPRQALDICGNMAVSGQTFLNNSPTLTYTTLPTFTSAQIGFTAITGSSTTLIPPTTAANVQTIALPSAGVWMVEGQIQQGYSSLTTPVVITVSLSTTTNLHDPTRQQTTTPTITSSSTIYIRVNSIFSVGPSTTVCLVANYVGTFMISPSVASHTIRYTRIA